MISIAIINLKGGVGKSVTACNLAAELAAKSKSVLVVDLDKQGNTSKFFGVLDYDSPSVAEVMLGEDDILAAIVKGVDVWGVHLIAVDDLARFSGHVNGFQYRECFAVRIGPNGERAGRDGDINALEWHKRWYSTGAVIENYIAEDIERSEKK